MEDRPNPLESASRQRVLGPEQTVVPVKAENATRGMTIKVPDPPELVWADPGGRPETATHPEV
jgi:hypothetical protein